MIFFAAARINRVAGVNVGIDRRFTAQRGFVRIEHGRHVVGLTPPWSVSALLSLMRQDLLGVGDLQRGVVSELATARDRNSWGLGRTLCRRSIAASKPRYIQRQPEVLEKDVACVVCHALDQENRSGIRRCARR